LDPANGQAWHLLAKAQEEQKAGAGLASYVRAAALAPANPDVQRDAGLALHEAGETDGIEALTTALDLQPGDVQTRYRLGRALYQAEDLDGARDQFRTTLDLLAEGARASTELMDGRSFDSVTWLSVVKGCHHNLAQIAGRRKQPEIAAAHQKRFDDMNRYIRDTYHLFTALKERPEDSAAQRRLEALYVRFGLPASGPTGKAAADRWIGP
jgi:tetratricopeptide (TPR) repeat protein